MPQFDFTTYSAQIFWFGLCFAALYYFMASVILPRIREILSERKNIISQDLFNAESLDEQNNSVKIKTDEVLLAADLQYKIALENATKEAARLKEKALEEFKTKAAQMIEKSKAEIDKMVEQSASKNEELAKQVATLTQNKIFNS